MLSDLRYAPHDHVIHRRGIDPGFGQHMVDYSGRKIDRVPVLERAASSATGAAYGRNDICFRHFGFPSKLYDQRGGMRIAPSRRIASPFM